MKNIKFVAFDVETSAMKKPRFICQLGISIVNFDNEIIETKSFYIQPPNNEIAPQLTLVHGITSDNTKDAPDFKTVWNDIKHLFNDTIVAHNASFDCSVLSENLDYYNLDSSMLGECECTYQIFNRRLDELCCGFNINCSDHHDAGFDAECCAKFYINYLNDIEPNEELMSDMPPQKKKERYFSENEKLKGDVLVKDLSKADPSGFFYDKKVVITGTFSIERKKLAFMLKDMGADIDTAISKYTNYVLTGSKAGPVKLKTIKKLQDEGYSIRAIEEDELLSILL